MPSLKNTALIFLELFSIEEEGFSRKKSASSRIPKIYKHVTPSKRNIYQNP